MSRGRTQATGLHRDFRAENSQRAERDWLRFNDWRSDGAGRGGFCRIKWFVEFGVAQRNAPGVGELPIHYTDSG